MNIALIGYRGTGKTSVGKLLAKKLNRKLLSTDKMIIKKAGMPINKIVKKCGWNRFRHLESEAIKNISGKDNCIIDSGGGVILKNKNIDVMARSIFCFGFFTEKFLKSKILPLSIFLFIKWAVTPKILSFL